VVGVPGVSYLTTSPPGRPSTINLQDLADRRYLGEDARGLARAGVRVRRMGRDPQPSAGAHRRDSQSVKKSTGVVGGEQRGDDGAKKVKGRKRHLLVDTQGLALKAKVVHAASIMDFDGIEMLLLCAGQMRGSPDSSTCGWTALTAERTKARIGCRRL
jgi:hypothetical protein